MSDISAATPLTPALDVLAAPEVRRQLHRLSVDEYHRLGEQGIIGERTELIRGVVVDKMSQSPLHVFLVQLLSDWLRQGVGEGWTIRLGNPVTTGDSEPEPDICVAPGKPKDYLTGHPKTGPLAIEVAVTSEKMDRVKASIYAEISIEEYWIVLAEEQSVEVFRQPVDGRFQSVTTLKVGDTLSPLAFPELTMPVTELFPDDA